MLRRLLRGTNAATVSKEGQTAPSVSVVIPLYNHGRFIGEAIDSVLAGQSGLSELIVVDDGSTDDSYAEACVCAGSDPRVVVWKQPNRGAHAAINAGLGRATGRYVAILNSDDTFRPGRLVQVTALMDSNPGIWMAASGIEFIDGSGREVRNDWHETALAFGAASGDLATTLLNGNVLVSTSNFVIRRDVLDRVGPFSPLRYAHDLDFALRILLCGGRIGQVEDRLLRYRMHESNTIEEDHRRVRAEWAMVAGAFLQGLSAITAKEAHWDRLRTVLPVLETHKILQGATLSAAYLHRQGTNSIAQSGITSDPAFLDVLRSSV